MSSTGSLTARLPGVFARAKSLIALTDLDISWSEHGGAIAQENARLARHLLQALRVLYHLPVHGVRQGTHESGIKVGDEQCRVLAIKRQSSHNVPPVSVYNTPGPCQQASASPVACQPGGRSPVKEVAVVIR